MFFAVFDTLEFELLCTVVVVFFLVVVVGGNLFWFCLFWVFLSLRVGDEREKVKDRRGAWLLINIVGTCMVWQCGCETYIHCKGNHATGTMCLYCCLLFLSLLPLFFFLFHHPHPQVFVCVCIIYGQK